MSSLTTNTSYQQYQDERGDWPYTVTPVPTGHSVSDLPSAFQADGHELKFKTEETDEDGESYVFAGTMPRQLIENSTVKENQPYWIGIDQRGQVYSLQLKDRFRHLIITGFTGTGKTTRAVNDVVDSAYRGHGAIVTDPGGEMTYDVIKRLPEDRLSDLVVIDPKADYLDKRVGFNLLETYHAPGEPGFEAEVRAVVDDLLAFLDADGYAFITPVITHVTRALIEANHNDSDYTYTVSDQRWLLGHGGSAGDVEYAQFVREKKLNPLLELYAEELDAVDKDKFDPILRRLDELVLDDIFRPLFASRSPQLSVADIFDQALIVLVKCDVHPELRERINAFFTRKMFSIISSRPLGGELDVREALGVSNPEERPTFEPFHLVVDECHSVFSDESTQEVRDMFAEFRKRRVALTLLTQAFHQIPSEIQKAVQTNAQPIAYDPGGERGEKGDVASGLPGVSKDQLNLNDYHAWVSPLADDAKPFICEMFPMLPPVRDMRAVAQAIKASAEKWGVVPETAREVAESSFGSGQATDRTPITEAVRRRSYHAFYDGLCASRDQSGWIPLERVGNRLERYLVALTTDPHVEGDYDPNPRVERLLDRLCEEHLERKPIDGTAHYRVTSAGLDMVFRQSKNDRGTPTDGGDGHHLDVRGLHNEFTSLGWRYDVVRQGGSAELPDAILFEPFHDRVRDSMNPRKTLSDLRREYPIRYLLSGGARYSAVEPEHANTSNPSQLLANLRGALNTDRPCVFVVGEDTQDTHRPTKNAELVEKYVTDESRYDDAGIEPESVAPIACPGEWNVIVRPDSGPRSAWDDDGLRLYLGDRQVLPLNDVAAETLNRLEARSA